MSYHIYKQDAGARKRLRGHAKQRKGKVTILKRKKNKKEGKIVAVTSLTV